MKSFVTPFVGVWIEIYAHKRGCGGNIVTPFVGVWIEISSTAPTTQDNGVTPFVGVWIEMTGAEQNKENSSGHSLRGSVD